MGPHCLLEGVKWSCEAPGWGKGITREEEASYPVGVNPRLGTSADRGPRVCGDRGEIGKWGMNESPPQAEGTDGGARWHQQERHQKSGVKRQGP